LEFGGDGRNEHLVGFWTCGKHKIGNGVGVGAT